MFVQHLHLKTQGCHGFSQLGWGIEPTTLAIAQTPSNKSDYFSTQSFRFLVENKTSKTVLRLPGLGGILQFCFVPEFPIIAVRILLPLNADSENTKSYHSSLYHFFTSSITNQ